MFKNSLGILLINTGTPDAPTTKAVRSYLREFLSDPHVVKLPRLIWLPILYGLVLPFRSPKSAHLYQQIWTPQGSPMRHFMQNIAALLQKENNIAVELGMNYGKPSIQQGIDNLISQQVNHIIILPLFPQFSNATSTSSFERVNHALKKHSDKISVSFIHDYHDHAAYISALAASVQQTWIEKGKSDHLLISFHGIPERFTRAGDPYAKQCEQTALLLAETLNLDETQWTRCYQSRFGYDKWLQPATQDLLETFPQKGIKSLDIVCPGFPVDCLETLEEIAITGKALFVKSGGQDLRYIPALNDAEWQIQLLSEIVSKFTLSS